MSRENKFSFRLFRGVCIVFSVFLLLMSLIAHAELMDVEENILIIESGLEDAQRQAELLRVRFENRISLSELEHIATEVLGMHRPAASQLYYGNTVLE